MWNERSKWIFCLEGQRLRKSLRLVLLVTIRVTWKLAWSIPESVPRPCFPFLAIIRVSKNEKHPSSFLETRISLSSRSKIIGNRLQIRVFFNFQKNIIESTFQGFISLPSVCRSRQKMKNTIEDKSHDIPEICVDKILLVPPVKEKPRNSYFTHL